MAQAVTGKPTPSATARRKRREETERGFKLARALTNKIRRSILRYLYAPSLPDPEQQRAEVELWLRVQTDPGTNGDHVQEQHGSFHYARASGFDAHL